jgi:FHS family L-fucose permease-like MFS transporter
VNIAVDTPSSTGPSSNGQKPRLFPVGHMVPFVLVTVLFFIWGMSNNLTDILVQQFKKSFELSPLQAQLVQTAVFLGYFFMALPAALGMRKWGYKAGILAGLCLFGLGTLMFWPAAVIGRYWLMLTALFVVGCGSATLETAANPFIAQTGAPETSEQRLNFSQAFNPPGTIMGVLIGTFFIFSGVELSASKVAEMKVAGTYAAYLHGEIMRVVPTYVTLGCVVLLLALVIGLTRFPANAREHDASEEHNLGSQLLSLLRSPGLLAAIVAQFCYCGAQVSTWSAFIPYVKQYTHATERTAALFLTGNLIAFAAGRIISTGLMRWFAPAKMMGVYAIVNIGLIALGILHPGLVGAGALLLTSFFMSVMFPTIFALGVKGLGPRTKLGGSLIVMSVVGAAVVPPLLGLIAKHFGSYALGYGVVIACYVVVAVYGLRPRPVTSVHTVPVMP